MRPFLLSAEHDPDASPPGGDVSGTARAERSATIPPASVVEDLSGTQLEGYGLEALVGQGLVGSVYRARHGVDGSLVALKVLAPRLRSDANVVRRFAREAEAARQLVHPNIARVLAHGSPGGMPFVCSEWVEGAPLTLVVRRSPLTLRRALVPICDILSALSSAQRAGVVHGCVKPGNVMVSEGADGALVPKLRDFGMARLLKPVAGTGRTKAGMACALPEYVTPEQIACEGVDGRTDVYAVGLLLYELLTGEPPFCGGSFEAILRRQRKEPLLTLVSREHKERKIPREIEGICLRALAKEPGGRYLSPLEMARALRAALDLYGARADLPLQPEPSLDELHTVSKDRLTMPGEQLRSRHKLGLGALLLLLVCGVVWLSAPRSTRESDDAIAAALSAGQRSLEQGRQQLAEGDVAGAIKALRAAEAELGPSPPVQRWLGEALLRAGQRAQGEALLRSYLSSHAQPPDRGRVETLLSGAEASP